MKAVLDKYLRELTEKEFIIKEEREKLDEQHKQIREFEVKEKVKKEQNTSTPLSDKHPHDY